MKKIEHASLQAAQGRRERPWIGVGALLMLVLLGVPSVGTAEVSTATIPSTAAHLFSSRPMIAGTVVSVNDHRLVVDTEQGERITLQVDSRTMAPRDLAPGMTVRTEFTALENCRFRAQRVTAVQPGASGQRLQAYANTREEPVVRQASAQRDAQQTGTQLAGTPHATGYARSASEPPIATVPKATPGTLDHYYSTHPLISGTVLAVNDHRVVVATDQGQKIAMVMDSRTLVPRELAPGSIMRAEFTEMQDGRFYAKRVSVVGAGAPGRQQAYANTRDDDVAMAGIVGDCESVSPTPGHTTTTASVEGHGEPVAATSADRSPSDTPVERSSVDGTADRTMTPDRSAGGSEADEERAEGIDSRAQEEPESLPQTASGRPLLLLLGLLGLASAGVFTMLRGNRAA